MRSTVTNETRRRLIESPSFRPTKPGLARELEKATAQQPRASAGARLPAATSISAVRFACLSFDGAPKRRSRERKRAREQRAA